MKSKKIQLPKPLKKSQVFSVCSPSSIPASNTKKIKAAHGIIAQDRAIRAIDFGLGIRRSGYNIYVAGDQGTNKSGVIQSYLAKFAKNSPPPPDWIFLHNFQNSDAPIVLSLPNGTAHQLVKLMSQVIRSLQKELIAVLQSEDYEVEVNEHLSNSNERQSKKYSELERHARKMNFQIKSTRSGIETIPILDGNPLTEKEYNKLSKQQRIKVENKRALLEPHVLSFARRIRAIETETKQRVSKLQRKFVQEVLEKIFAKVRDEFGKIPGIANHIDHSCDYILDNLSDFVNLEDHNHPEDEEQIFFRPVSDNRDVYRKFKVNLFVDNRTQKTAPVILETNPNFYTLFGKIEKNIEHGMFFTDFTMIKAGSIHRANNGYLILNANDILKVPAVWETLKRMLSSKLGFIEDMGEHLSLLPTSGLRPESIPLDVKIILIGSDEIYHLLYDLDPEFAKTFKIKADFDYKMPRNPENIRAYASFISACCDRENLLPFDGSGIAAIVEQGSRIAEHQKQLSTNFGEIKALAIEADFIAREENSRSTKRAHVVTALEEKHQRVALYEAHLMEALQNKDILLELSGSGVGQVNGLAVYDFGDHSFGKPGRITCTVSANDEGIFNIERASKLSGNIHDKGMYILTGFLNTLLARKYSLALSASVCFEQSYGIIDGDSASVAELIAIISAMANVPIDLSFAVTGSLNQLGEVQGVGGINEKVEGFYKTCCVLKQPHPYQIIIPEQNVQNLMLSPSTQEAIHKKELLIYPVQMFYQAFELVSNCSFGATSVLDTKFKPDSALERIRLRLEELHEDESQKDKEKEKGREDKK